MTQPQDRREAVTDPRFIYQDDNNVIAYRLGIVEGDIKDLGVKLDKVINEYPTNSILQLILQPMREELKDLKEKREEEAKDKVKNAQQIKFMTYAAIIGPLATFAITLVMGYVLGDIPSGN